MHAAMELEAAAIVVNPAGHASQGCWLPPAEKVPILHTDADPSGW